MAAAPAILLQFYVNQRGLSIGVNTTLVRNVDSLCRAADLHSLAHPVRPMGGIYRAARGRQINQPFPIFAVKFVLVLLGQLIQLLQQPDKFGDQAIILHFKNRQGHRQGEPPGAGAAGVEIEDAVLALLVGPVGVAEDDRGQARSPGVQVQGKEFMEDVKLEAPHLYHPGPG